MSKDLKNNDIARYKGPTVEGMGLYNGWVYNITSVSEGLGVSINGSALYFNQEQFEKVHENVKTVVCDLETLTGSTESDLKIGVNRKMKFSKKPGSAVVHYTAGQTFHISNLLALEVSHDYDDGDSVMVTRGYMKDGVTFVETVGIPVLMLSHIDWEPNKGSEHEGQTIKLTYSFEKRSIVYSVSFTANSLDFT